MVVSNIPNNDPHDPGPTIRSMFTTPPAQQTPHSDDLGSKGFVVEISDTQGLLHVDHEKISGLVRRVLQGEGIEVASISLTLVDNSTIHRINREHLEHDWPTDVITFPLSDSSERVLVGELIISVEMAVVTAAAIKADPWAELSLYIVHGLLHLCGYDDGAQDDSKRMRAREDLVLLRAGLTNTFALAERRPIGEEQERAAWSR
jgi:probable rRNA maturation factor